MEDKFPENELERERETLLERLQEWMEIPMLFLALAWLGLFVVEMVWGLSPLLLACEHLIWAIFILDFVVKFALAPGKIRFLRQNWLGLAALAIPAFRLFRIVNLLRLSTAAGAVRGLRLLRTLTTINRAMKALSATMGRRGFGYVMLLTLLITFSGAAGIYSFEKHLPDGQGLESYGAALWWTAMVMTTMGSQYWPRTAEGRLLCFFLALYSFTVFGYVTATLASFFIGRDAENEEAELASARSIAELKQDISALTEEISLLRKEMDRKREEKERR
jgi:voltage-gated potassium channel